MAHGGIEGSLVIGFAFGLEQPRGLFERGQVPSRVVDPRFISGDRSCEFIPFAAQGGSDVHLLILEQNMNNVNVYSELSEAAM